MALQDELQQIRDQARSGAGVPSAEERHSGAQEHYTKLLGGRGGFQEQLGQRMRERDVRGASIQKELRGVQSEIPQIRPQMMQKYGAAEPGGMPSMRPEDLTALIAGREASKERQAQGLQDVYNRRAGTLQDVIGSALQAYDIESAMAGTQAESARGALERALAGAGEEASMVWGSREAEKDRALQRYMAQLSAAGRGPSVKDLEDEEQANFLGEATLLTQQALGLGADVLPSLAQWQQNPESWGRVWNYLRAKYPNRSNEEIDAAMGAIGGANIVFPQGGAVEEPTGFLPESFQFGGGAYNWLRDYLTPFTRIGRTEAPFSGGGGGGGAGGAG